MGYTTPETVNISFPGKTLRFNDEISSLRSVVNELVSSASVNKIIAIGHAGIGKDREICKKVRGIDIVVGGHTNTFLYSGTPPSTDSPEGSYPEVYRDTGNPCLVVQDYAFGKYLGFLQVRKASRKMLNVTVSMGHGECQNGKANHVFSSKKIFVPFFTVKVPWGFTSDTAWRDCTYRIS